MKSKYFVRLIKKTFILFRVKGLGYTWAYFMSFFFRKVSHSQKIELIDIDVQKYKKFHFNQKGVIPSNILVSIVIPTKDKTDILDQAIRGILDNTYQKYEIIIIDHESKEAESVNYFKSLSSNTKIKILEYKGEFNFSKINNFAVEHAKGDVLLFLNNDVKPINSNWLENMLKVLFTINVGIVGAELVYPDETIQHAGVSFGTDDFTFLTRHDFAHLSRDEFEKNLSYDRKVSAVTGACLMIRKTDFILLGKFDENLSVVYQDVDLCFKVSQQNKLVIITPNSKLYHYESATRKEKFSDVEFSNWCHFILKWKPKLLNPDPYRLRRYYRLIH